MNREIKFRAWIHDNKNITDGYMDDNVFLWSDTTIWIDGDVCDIDECIKIMQYTGLHDKNGKEIYEGDIISNPRYEETYIVEYHIDGYVGWGDDRVCGCYLITDDDIEVIGNIHENPELLK